MTSLLELTAGRPSRTLAPGEALVVQGETGGHLFVLESGELVVERDGVKLATISQPGTPIGEMSILLGTRNSATVRAETATQVKVVDDARAHLAQDNALTLRLAELVAGRLNATSALVVELSKQRQKGDSVLSRIFAALHLPADDTGYTTIDRHDLFAPDDRSGG